MALFLSSQSGCPVLVGEKWITTAWMREGVSKADPWTVFDPNGVRLMADEVSSGEEEEEPSPKDEL